MLFKIATSKDAGDNWMICDCGMDSADDKNYWVTTDGIHASELHRVSGGAKADAELIARLLDEYWSKRMKP